MELVRYINLNPLRAGIVSKVRELEGYPYCGHSALMGRRKIPWQDVGYVLGYFGQKAPDARKAYRKYLEEGAQQGRREDLTGGGLIRSLGGWSEVWKRRGMGKDHMMGDERILGDSRFVDSILDGANEAYERRYELKRRGFDLERIGKRVAEICGLEEEEVFSKGRQRTKVKARNLLCFWAVREAGMTLRSLAKRLGISSPGVGYAVERGEALVREKQYRLME
jgi:hypothetical protein